MIVVAIIGILASIAITIYDVYSKKTKVAEVSNALGAAMSAAQQFHGEQGRWPDWTGGSFYVICTNSFGITLPTTYVGNAQYRSDTPAPNDTEINITAAFTGGIKAIGVGVDGEILVLRSGVDGGMRTWDSSSTIASKYRPQ